MLRLRCSLVIVLAFWLAPGEFAYCADPVADPGQQLNYATEIRPLLMKYCGECHQGDQANAGVAFDELTEERATSHDRSKWKKIHVQITNKIMPPLDEVQPTDEERQKLLDWVNSHALTVNCSDVVYPGRVTIRRLNRAEYNNTIRDLFGVDFQPASTFPADDTGYGFDNIGDVLTLPPVLFERYLEAAEQVSRRTILAPDEDFARETIQEGGTAASNNEIAKEFDFLVYDKLRWPAALRRHNRLVRTPSLKNHNSKRLVAAWHTDNVAGLEQIHQLRPAAVPEHARRVRHAQTAGDHFDFVL